MLPYPCPLAKLLGLWHRQQMNLLLSTQSLHKLFVVWLIAVFRQNAQLCCVLLYGTSGLAQTSAKAIVSQCLLEHKLHSRVDVHRLPRGGGSRLGGHRGIGSLLATRSVRKKWLRPLQRLLENMRE